MSPEEALDRFGTFLMRRVRDEAISYWDMIVAGEMKGKRAQDIHTRVEKLPADAVAVLHDLIPQVVDSTLHQLLWGLEEADDITVDVDDVHDIKSVSDGLAGELYTEDGWIAEFSQQRSVKLE